MLLFVQFTAESAGKVGTVFSFLLLLLLAYSVIAFEIHRFQFALHYLLFNFHISRISISMTI